MHRGEIPNLHCRPSKRKEATVRSPSYSRHWGVSVLHIFQAFLFCFLDVIGWGRGTVWLKEGSVKGDRVVAWATNSDGYG